MLDRATVGQAIRGAQVSALNRACFSGLSGLIAMMLLMGLSAFTGI